jgi:hypothetical protein
MKDDVLFAAFFLSLSRLATRDLRSDWTTALTCMLHLSPLHGTLFKLATDKKALSKQNTCSAHTSVQLIT